MNYGEISISKCNLPRFSLFDARTLSRQIMAETVGLRGQTPSRQFGGGKVWTFYDRVIAGMGCTIFVHIPTYSCGFSYPSTVLRFFCSLERMLPSFTGEAQRVLH
jgi:hypothetical protein